MKRRSLLAVLITTLVGVGNVHADPGACSAYARTAVRQNTDNQQRRCGPSGSRWQSNFSAHFEWCKGAGKSEADNVQAARVSDLARCVTAVEPGDDMLYCRQHARLAVAEYNENVQRGCGISGPGWSPDEEEHYQWCMHNGRAAADAWYSGRMQSLSHCNPTVPVNPARGYQLFFDGTLVSGPDAANYSLDDAKRNCAYNMYNRPKVKVVCRYNGQDMMVR